jgi:hypothetical protein
MYIAEQNLKEYYKKLLSILTRKVDCYKEQIQIYEQEYKKAKILSNTGFWLGVSSLVIVTVISILKAVVK